MTKPIDLKAIRQALADYMWSEGCACCRNEVAHNEAKVRLGKLLKASKYADGSGYDFVKYRTPECAAKGSL